MFKPVWFIIVYCAALICYLYTRNGKKKLYRAINKYLMASMYLILAFVKFARGYGLRTYHLLLLPALILAFLGDVFLVFDFGRGGDFFLAGNLCFIFYEQAVLSSHGIPLTRRWWIFAVAALIIISLGWAATKYPEKVKMEKMKYPMLFYLSSIVTHGLSGLAMMIYLSDTRFLVMGLGSLLFMFSDLILTTYKFIIRENNTWLVRLNSLTYFPGLLLIVLAM